MSEQKRTDPDGKQSIGMDDVTETNEIKIDISQIPDHVKDEITSATLNAVIEFLRQPGGREFLDNRKAHKAVGVDSLIISFAQQLPYNDE